MEDFTWQKTYCNQNQKTTNIWEMLFLTHIKDKELIYKEFLKFEKGPKTQ